MARCSKNLKHFLGVSYYGRHVFVVVGIKKFIRGADDFMLQWQCLNCGFTREQHFVQEDELMLMGLGRDELNLVSNNWRTVFHLANGKLTTK